MPCLNVNLFWLQCPARWTNLQAVVTPGVNPLPAKVRIKCHRNDEVAKTFFFMDQNRADKTLKTLLAQNIYGPRPAASEGTGRKEHNNGFRIFQVH